ncbi:hypothetical protein QMA10_04980 [Arthrobacter sp. APC 3897]|uniref:hypothetical protein n=1 Tax=Arthrobacter sp. APC 3897 TaxID=3035204 RepID=UPI0025B5DF33|nr:hypothetical protein [Arthrobacter sp. APC 3897]MDN3481276.1 hypothetical protein [Arthrobacter sp. APC 3897]
MFRPLKGLSILALAALALSACGDSAGAPSADSASPSVSVSASPTATGTTAPDASSSATSLTVEYREDGETASAGWTLNCDGASLTGSSDAPDPAAACAVLAEKGTALFAAPDANLMCTQMIKGQQRARVTGTVNGEAVDQTFSLRDGCQIGRWESLAALLGPAEGKLR